MTGHALLAMIWAAQATQPPSANPATPPASPPPVSFAVPVAHSAGLFIASRIGLSLLWPDAYDSLPLDRSARQFARAYTAPPEFRRDRSIVESDGDPWFINVAGHGVLGMEIHGRARRCGAGFWQALAFTTAASTVWEYGIESWSKRPSAVDLALTPLLGAALGEARSAAQRHLARRPRGFWRRLTEIVIDPLGEGERGLLGTRC